MSEVSSRPITVALAGNPNSGKTTVFNELTGARQHVGNYPGVTVEKKEGEREHAGRRLHVVDLPGTYSLTAYSIEEIVARDFVIEERPDVIVDVVDASNLERNLYLTSMFIELDVPVVVALNMMDVAEARGKHIDVALLAELLGVRVVPIIARRGEGMTALLDAIVAAADEGQAEEVHVNFGRELEPHIAQLAAAITQRDLAGRLPARWLAIKLLEDDGQIRERFAAAGETGAEILALAEGERRHLQQIIGDDAEVALADRRYGFVSGACREAVSDIRLRRTDWSERVDAVVANRVIGLPVFFLFMWLMFELVFRLGNPLMGGLDSFFAWLGTMARSSLPPGQLQSLLADGIIGGVGGVLVFLPNILLLFLAISFLEDSGYMARAAFVVDRVMHHVGLHGKSFISMLIGFGCTVPAVLSTRMLESPRERLVTILVVPLMSCGARLPVYILLAGAFFPPALAGKVIFAVYALGVLLALLMARLFSKFLLVGPSRPFVMELPPYRWPTLKGTAVHMWDRGWMYVKKAGTTILAMSICMWFLLSHPVLPPDPSLTRQQHAQAAIEHSYAGRLGRVLEPALRPVGFDYRIATALVAGLAAKEIVVSTMATVHSLGDSDENSLELREALRRDRALDPLVALTLMVFVLIYIPCASTIAAIYKETCSWRWTGFAVVYTCALAWVVSFIVYQVGRLIV
jgi:ferrous iron transport protein B